MLSLEIDQKVSVVVEEGAIISSCIKSPPLMSRPLFLILPDSVEGIGQMAPLTNVERRDSS
jgi:hypothetical protein